MESHIIDTTSKKTATQIPSSIYEAIVNDDWEGLLALYATTVCDAVHTAEFLKSIQGDNWDEEGFGGLDWTLSPPLPSSNSQQIRGNNGGTHFSMIRDEKKFETAHQPPGSFSSNLLTRSLAIRELDTIAHEIIGFKIFGGRLQQFSTNVKSDGDVRMNDVQPPQQSPMSTQQTSNQPFKKTRQHSLSHSTRLKLPQGSFLVGNSPRYNQISSLPYSSFFRNCAKVFSQGRHINMSPGRTLGFLQSSIPSPLGSPSTNQRKKNVSNNSNSSQDQIEMKWDIIMWENAAILSNSNPSPSFVVDRQQRIRREGNMNDSESNTDSSLKSDSDAPFRSPHNASNENEINPSLNSPTPLFEGNLANSTPGDISNGGTGSGTAQHLACLLDSPLALAILIVMGVNVGARHTAFRRLAMHEAACADSPHCLRLLMSAATGFYLESKIESRGKDDTAVGSLDDSFANSNVVDASKYEKLKVSFLTGWASGKDKASSHSDYDDDDEVERTSFPFALKIIWNVIKLVRSGEMSEMDAASYILERVSVASETKLILASQLGFGIEAEALRSREIFGFASSVQQQPPPRVQNNIDDHGNTPLHWAAFKNSVRAIDVLLTFNVDVNFCAQPSGWTPLHDAAYSDSAAAVKRLIGAGALVDARSHSGASPLCFAAQEDSFNATQLLLEAGADPAIRCLGQSPGIHFRANNADNHIFHSRFSGYTPLHYCAHYNSSRSARVLLKHTSYARANHLSGVDLLEIPDLNDKLPIHVAVARGSSEVLRELLHGGARVETLSHNSTSPGLCSEVVDVSPPVVVTSPMAIPMNLSGESVSPHVVTPVSSPVLRSLLPSHPINSPKPWNCLSQQSIDACRSLIEEVELNWTPARHDLFTPTDRFAIREVLRVGKRLEQNGSGLFLEVWPFILSFCGRGWFSVELEEVNADTGVSGDKSSSRTGGLNYSSSMSDDSSDEDMEFTQFDLDGTHA